MERTVLNLEHQITAFLNTDNKSNCTVHFDYREEHSFDKGKGNGNNPTTEWEVTARTYNPVTEETFLLKSTIAKTKEIALKKIFDILKKQKGENSFTVKWAKKGDNTEGIIDSYFFVHDVLDVVENFFHGKNPEEYIVYEIKLNPIS